MKMNFSEPSVELIPMGTDVISTSECLEHSCSSHSCLAHGDVCTNITYSASC